MRKFVLAAVLVLMASSAQASSYLDIFGNIINPIQYITGGNHLYSGPNLEPSANLPNSNLPNADLASADLSFAHMNGSDLVDTNLANANLASGSLASATLIGANLSGATLDFTTLHSANLTGANLTGASLQSVLLTATNLSGTTLDGVVFAGSTFLIADFTNASVIGADFSNANLQNATFLGSTSGIAFYDANTNFALAWDGANNSAIFDPVAAGWTLLPNVSTQSPGVFCIDADGDGSDWSWQLDANAPVTVTGPVPSAAVDLRDAFVSSVNLAAIAGLSATPGPGAACFTVAYSSPFQFWVGPPGGPVTCLLAGNPLGCSFNPMIYEQAFLPVPVPALGPWGLTAVVGALAAIAVIVGSRRRARPRPTRI
ncbi:MAG TPA: pentapeptide repeat-containing protein [Myxococcales bacterium]|nr:pentapeptide repeat-containing protein [Myxococcales bacterium]